MERLVYYSLSASARSPRPDLTWQLEQSIRSLRAYNSTVRIVVFTYGDIPPDLVPRLSPLGVSFCHKGSYEAMLVRYAPRAWQCLSLYPLLHKFLNFPELAALNPDQILFLDCDTLFFGDVAEIFARYSKADCYAREEPTCARSHYGYDPAYLNETSLQELCLRERLSPVQPFNLGVVSFNNGLWNRLAELQPLILSYAWRFSVWMALNPPSGVAANYGEGQGIDYLRAYFDQLTGEADIVSALPYPSANRWILDQVALWMAIGHLPELTYSDYSRDRILQNGELLTRDPGNPGCLLCHYFSQNTQRVSDWLSGSAASFPVTPDCPKTTHEVKHGYAESHS